MPRMGGSAGTKPLSEDIILKKIDRLVQTDKTEDNDLFDMIDMVLWELRGGRKRAEREKKKAHYFRKVSVWRKPIRRAWKENFWPWFMSL